LCALRCTCVSANTPSIVLVTTRQWVPLVHKRLLTVVLPRLPWHMLQPHAAATPPLAHAPHPPRALCPAAGTAASTCLTTSGRRTAGWGTTRTRMPRSPAGGCLLSRRCCCGARCCMQPIIGWWHGTHPDAKVASWWVPLW